jgi:hypothetical protein
MLYGGGKRERGGGEREGEEHRKRGNKFRWRRQWVGRGKDDVSAGVIAVRGRSNGNKGGVGKEGRTVGKANGRGIRKVRAGDEENEKRGLIKEIYITQNNTYIHLVIYKQAYYI